MRLADWLKQNDVTQAQFAKDIDVSQGLISGYLDGSIWPGKDKAERIFKATNGDVTPTDFLEAAE